MEHDFKHNIHSNIARQEQWTHKQSQQIQLPKLQLWRYKPNSENQYKDPTSYGDDNTKERYTEGNEFWNNPNKKDIDVSKKDNSDDFTKSAYEKGKDFWNSLNKTIKFKK